MSETFKAGDKVTHRSYGEGVVTYGPYKNTFGDDAYLVRVETGVEKTWFGRFLSLIPEPPKFAVGDEVRYEYGGGGKLVAGPFKSEHHDEPIWVVEKPNGTHMTPTQNSLTKVEAAGPIKVGDRVRVLRAAFVPQCHGAVGTVTSTSETYRAGLLDRHPYLVRFDGGDEVYAAEVARVSGPADVITHDGVTYDLSAEYRDRDGDGLRIKLVDGAPLVAWFGETPEAGSRTLAEALLKYGPFTRVTG